MNGLPSRVLALGLLGAAGCAPRVWIVEGKNRIIQPALEQGAPSSAAEPAFCVSRFQDFWSAGEAPLARWGGLGAVAEMIKTSAPFRSLRVSGVDAPSSAPCDLDVTVLLSRGDASGAKCSAVVLRPGAGGPEVLRVNACAGKPPLPYAVRVMHQSYQPGTPYYTRWSSQRGPAGGFASSVPVANPVLSAPAAVPAAPRSEVDELPAARAVSSKRHAVVIGVERYRENLPKADFAAGDARLAAEYFKRVLGVPEENLALLIDERAAKSDFEKYFERWLPNRVEAGDEVFVYFSGHGTPNPAKGDAYLVPYDGDPTYIDQTGYPLKRMYEQLAKLPAQSVTVAMDSCFSGAGGRSVLAKGARPLVTVSAVEALPAKVTVLAASAGDQISNSYQEKGHGLFTYFLLKGLKERGPDLKGVFEYLKPEVARTARRELNSDQDPQWREGR
ncbi:MAG: caspase family protein [Elusimicrobia bacterium]|nr:caspase family protein [Elusimicrobiota bacterium]